MKSPPHMLPPPPRVFVNRQSELAAIDRFTRGAPGPSVVLLTGLSGVGKTATGLRWAHVNRDRFPDGQLCADLGHGGVAPGEVLATFLRVLGLPDRALPESLVERAAAYRMLTRDKRLLVLLDDMQTAEQLEPLIPDSETSVVLVTGRSWQRELTKHDVLTLELGPLDLPSARAWLEALGARVHEDTKAVDELVHITGGHPLALSVVGAKLSMGRRSVGELVSDLVHATGPEPDSDAVGASFRVYSDSYRALSSPAAQLYRRLAAHPGPSFTATLAQVAAGWGSRPVGIYLQELSQARLIEDRGTRSRFYEPLQRHAQVALALDEPDAEEPAMERIVAYYVASAAEVGHALDPGRERVVAPSSDAGVRLRSRREALAWFKAERPNLLAVQLSATRREWHHEARSLSVKVDDLKRKVDATIDLLSVADVIVGHELSGEFAMFAYPVARPEMERKPYTASGGASALLFMPDETTLRVEAHRGSFALVWGAHCSPAEMVALVERPIDREAASESSVLLADGDGAVAEGAFTDLRERLVAGDNVAFARLDLADLVVTWTRGATDGDHEIGLGAERFDAELFAELLRGTAVGDVATWAGEVVREARNVLETTQDGKLRRGDPDDDEAHAP